MWHLEKPTQEILDNYVKKLLPNLKKRIENDPNLRQVVKDVLLPLKADGSREVNILKSLLINEPADLFVLSESLMGQMITDYNFSELQDYSKAQKAFHKTPVQLALLSKYNLLSKLVVTFNYDVQLGNNKTRSYAMVAAANHNTCVYCNRQYTFNIVRNGGKNDDNRIARPALDHWFPKSLFPLMSLSYYNLIPSCTICNSAVKSDEIWSLSTHIHPYLTPPNVPVFKFRYKKGINNSWEIDFENLSGQEENTVKSLCLKEAYQAHSGLEIADLIELASKNNGSYMKQLYGEILKLYTGGGDKPKAYRLLLGTEMLPATFKNRPLSKMKKDIIEQIEKAQGMKFFE